MAKKVEIFRVLRYVGTPEFIKQHLDNRGVKGRRIMSDNCFIEEAFLGETFTDVIERYEGGEDNG